VLAVYWGSILDFWHVLAVAIALVFIIEGLLPFISPDRWRKLLIAADKMDDKVIRNIGLGSMLFGVLLLYIVH
jgi:uncharacterized protein YjeT (DUF2065 family)